ncbi:MAG: HAD hydrolase-like protein [Bacteroidetes bacterium]|nr:HAD hydrolase-like protein [Bacteroidota bacterium]
MQQQSNGKQIIHTLLLDIGGVLLTNGWGHESRSLAVKNFGLDKAEMEARHAQVFPGYEVGDFTLDEYLDWTIFYQPRSFLKQDFIDFMFTQSKPIAGSIALFQSLKEEYGLKVFALSNEGRELNDYRIKAFELDRLFDGFVSSCYVHLRKPNTQMLQLACDIAYTAKEHCLYVDDRLFLAQFGQSFGLPTIQFNSVQETKLALNNFQFLNHNR